MNDKAVIPIRLRLLFDAVCDEIATPDQLRELQDILGRDEQARSSFMAYCQLHVDLYFATRGRRSQEAIRKDIFADVARRPEFQRSRSWARCFTTRSTRSVPLSSL